MADSRKRRKSGGTRPPEQGQRIARQDATMDSRRRALDDMKIKMAKDLDRGGGWLSFRTPLPIIEHVLGVKIGDRISRAIGSYSQRRPFKVLNVGCGAGTALAELKERFGNKIKTVGAVMEKTPGEKYKGVDRLLVGDIKSANPRERYDLVYSYIGAVIHSGLKTTVLDRIISFLKPGGQAIINIGGPGPLQEPLLNEMRTLLDKKGIRDYRFARSAAIPTLVFRKPLKRLPK